MQDDLAPRGACPGQDASDRERTSEHDGIGCSGDLERQRNLLGRERDILAIGGACWVRRHQAEVVCRARLQSGDRLAHFDFRGSAAGRHRRCLCPVAGRRAELEGIDRFEPVWVDRSFERGRDGAHRWKPACVHRRDSRTGGRGRGPRAAWQRQRSACQQSADQPESPAGADRRHNLVTPCVGCSCTRRSSNSKARSTRSSRIEIKVLTATLIEKPGI